MTGEKLEEDKNLDKKEGFSPETNETPEKSLSDEEKEISSVEETVAEEIQEILSISEESDSALISEEPKVDTYSSVVPERKFLRKTKGKSSGISNFFEDVEEIGFDAKEVAERQNRDYKYFLKFQKYTHVNHFANTDIVGFCTYEKQYWNLCLFNKVCVVLRSSFSPFSSSPFHKDGICSSFEEETLYKPQNCIAYVDRSRYLTEQNFKRFSKAMSVIEADVFEESLIDEIHTEETILNCEAFLRSTTPEDFSIDESQVGLSQKGK